MKKEEKKDIFEKITSLAKRRGFIYPGSEIYGGLTGTWDYGPLGAELKRNIKNEFWKNMTQEHENIVGLDAAIIMNPKVWEASGHWIRFPIRSWNARNATIVSGRINWKKIRRLADVPIVAER